MIKELFEHVKHFGKTIMPKFDETLVKKVPVKATFNKGLKPKTMYKNQRRIFNKYFIKKDTKRLLISEPPGAGKSMTIMFIEAYKLLNIPGHKGIIVVPQNLGSKSFGKDTIKFDDGTIFHWNIYNDLCNTSDSQKVDRIIDFLYRRKFTNNPNERVLITTHTAMAIAFKRICHLNNLNELFDNTSFFIDEAHHIMYAKCSENFITNQIGALVQAINGNQNCSICLTTATPFRGDKNSIIPKEQMKTFDIHFLPLDKHWEENLQYIKSFTFDFVIYKLGGLFEGVKSIIKNKKKTIIFCPYQGHLIKESDKIKFRNKLISSILSVWPECKIMDLIETNGREPIKKKLHDNKTAGAFDVILTLKMFDESTDWVCAQQCIDLYPSNTLRIMYQRFGRLWRDFLGKTLIEYYCFLPFEADFKDEEKRREHLSNSYNVFIATLLLQETVDPIPYPVKMSNKVKVNPVEDDEISISPFDTVTDDENKREELLHTVIKKLLIMASHDTNPNSKEVYGWIESIVDEHGITEDKDEVIKHITKILRRTLKFGKKPDRVKEPIDISWMREAGFDEIWSNDILSGLLMFGTKVCGLEHFEEFRQIYDDRKSIEEWVLIAKQLEREHGGTVPSCLWLETHGYKALVSIIYKHLDKFTDINHEFGKLSIAKRKCIKEWVMIAEQLALENNGKLPSKKWIRKSKYTPLISILTQHKSLFAHIEQEKLTKSAKEWVSFAEELAAKNGGVLPISLHKKYGTLVSIINRYKSLFAHIKREKFQKTLEEWVSFAEELAAKNGGVLPVGVKSTKHGALYSMMRNRPEKFAHIRHAPSIKYLSEWVMIAEQLALENNGKLPTHSWLDNHKEYKSLNNMLRLYPERFLHIKREEKLRNNVDKWVEMVNSEIAKTNGILSTSFLCKHSTLYYMIRTYPDKFKGIRQEVRDKHSNLIRIKTIGEPNVVQL